MTTALKSTLSLRSEVRADGSLELSLREIPLPEPGPDEITVEIEAAPLHPADISQLLGAADRSSGRRTGAGASAKVVFKIGEERLPSMARRMGRSLPVGNEGAGTVIAAGDNQRQLVGRTVAIMGGAMLARHRVVNIADALLLPDGIGPVQGAAALINPLTLLTMIETMREEGHGAMGHTAAASSLGQILNRVCIEDGIPLVNIVRRPEQVPLLASQGASIVCDSSSPGFLRDLDDAVASTGATLAFDAVGGGPLAGQILTAMERALGADANEYRRYGSTIHKQVYLYGGLDTRPTQLDRSYGMAWSVGGWLLFERLKRLSPQTLAAMKARIAAGLATIFATEFAAELSLTDLMREDHLAAIAQRSTGEKFVIDPKRSLE